MFWQARLYQQIKGEEVDKNLKISLDVQVFSLASISLKFCNFTSKKATLFPGREKAKSKIKLNLDLKKKRKIFFSIYKYRY